MKEETIIEAMRQSRIEFDDLYEKFRNLRKACTITFAVALGSALTSIFAFFL